jgi:hypothetical protein
MFAYPGADQSSETDHFDNLIRRSDSNHHDLHQDSSPKRLQALH